MFIKVSQVIISTKYCISLSEDQFGTFEGISSVYSLFIKAGDNSKRGHVLNGP